jgi:hypothetical protein
MYVCMRFTYVNVCLRSAYVYVCIRMYTCVALPPFLPALPPICVNNHDNDSNNNNHNDISVRHRACCSRRRKAKMGRCSSSTNLKSFRTITFHRLCRFSRAPSNEEKDAGVGGGGEPADEYDSFFFWRMRARDAASQRRDAGDGAGEDAGESKSSESRREMRFFLQGCREMHLMCA